LFTDVGFQYIFSNKSGDCYKSSSSDKALDTLLLQINHFAFSAVVFY